MNETINQEVISQIKIKIMKALNDVSNLKKYNYQIAINVSENNLDDYIITNGKDINKLENELEDFKQQLTSLTNFSDENINE